MIQINLLDQAQARGRTRPARQRKSTGGGGSTFGTLVVLLTVALVLAGNAGLGWTLYRKVATAAEEPAALRRQIKQVEDKIAQTAGASEQVKAFEEVLNNQREVLRTLDPEDRILWSEKLNMLAALIPRDVFLSDIEIVEVVELVETEESIRQRQAWQKLDAKKRGPEPAVVQRPVIHYDVRLEGLATGRDSVAQFDNVLAFHRAMTSYEMTTPTGEKRRFMDGFVDNVDFNLIEATTYEGAPVNKFIFKLRTVNQGEQPRETPATDVAAGNEANPTQVANAR